MGSAAGVGLPGPGLVRVEVVRMIGRADPGGVVGMLLELDERGLGGRHRGGAAGVLVVGRAAPGAQQVVVMTLQSVSCGHRRGCRGVGTPCTPARSEGAPEIRVIQRGQFVETRRDETLQAWAGVAGHWWLECVALRGPRLCRSHHGRTPHYWMCASPVASRVDYEVISMSYSTDEDVLIVTREPFSKSTTTRTTTDLSTPSDCPVKVLLQKHNRKQEFSE
ncbi:hypothetical protein J6590_027764 [Homalodisca vitripennis]|nr:hypothetical protein J6590_027764 [Homalodisca vitripennis]